MDIIPLQEMKTYFSHAIKNMLLICRAERRIDVDKMALIEKDS